MNTNDARSLSSEQQKLLRIKVVDMVFRHSYTQRAAAEALGVSRVHANKWCRAFEEGGYQALELGRRGRRLNEKRLLQPHQCATIVNIIRDKTPDQAKMPFVLWERVAVRELIERKFGITIALRTVGEYLKRWGMTPQRPVERAREQNPKAVKKWLQESYPTIKKRAKREEATILWGDETGVQNCANTGRSFAPKGKTPIIKKQGKRLRINMISAVSNKGHVRFMVYSSKMTQQVFITYLKRVAGSFDRKVFMIVDNLKVHHGKLVKKWLQEHEKQLELFFIPSYSPELNPDEYLNRDLKKNVNRTTAPRTEEDLKHNLISQEEGSTRRSVHFLLQEQYQRCYECQMPRQPRIEYKGAVYHVMSRGNHGEQIFEDDHDRKQFLATLGEACEKTGIEVYAFVLMSNHYHMVLGTPEGNLVKGMAWLQSTYTQRYNAYHKTWGHLFQGRYKSILVDKKSSGYFRAVCDYVHLNPARAGLVDSKKKKLSSYRWSSAWSLGRDRADDPEWLKMDRICGAYSRFTTEEGSERLAYLRYLESRVEEERREKGTNEDYASIRRGWVFGEESFKSQMKKLLINSMEDKKRSSHTGESRRLHDESIALALIKESMQLLELTQESLPDIKKGDTRKVLISWLIRKKTSMSLEWIANQLSMGSRANVSRGIQVVEKNTIESVKEKKKQLLEMYRCAR